MAYTCVHTYHTWIPLYYVGPQDIIGGSVIEGLSTRKHISHLTFLQPAPLWILHRTVIMNTSCKLIKPWWCLANVVKKTEHIHTMHKHYGQQSTHIATISLTSEGCLAYSSVLSTATMFVSSSLVIRTMKFRAEVTCVDNILYIGPRHCRDFSVAPVATDCPAPFVAGVRGSGRCVGSSTSEWRSSPDQPSIHLTEVKPPTQFGS